MNKWVFCSIFAILFLALPACLSIERSESESTPVNPYLEEEIAVQVIATTRAEKTQAASGVSPYAEISNGKKTFLSFWIVWNDETVFLPVAESVMSGSGLLFCQLNSETQPAIGTLLSGYEIMEGKCLPAEKDLANALPIIKIPEYFEKGIETEVLNVIDLNGEFAHNFADIVTLIIQNDMLGSGDLTLSIHRIDGPNGEPSVEENAVPTYTLSTETLQKTFSREQVENFEGADDVVYALEQAFTWKIPAGYSELDLLPGDENWFVLLIDERNREPGKAYFQVRGVGQE